MKLLWRGVAASVGVVALLGLGSCGRPSLEDAKLSDRQLNLEEYFDGKTVAYGQFKDRFGTVRRRFKVEIDGAWDGKTLTLKEQFAYADGTAEVRNWSLTKTGDDSWTGTAPGVQRQATGREVGDTFNWTYTIDLPMPDGETMRVAFDDWMWLQEDGRLLNIAYMERFGVTLGEVTIFFEQRP
ncbi:DUF3833 domain-containing protein [Tritonibacter scottomollicae]|uniref:DUF3833 domain-containing protein n=1 Tax=Tritonibacter scottomollicae TaxID=483013 RepID=UPI003AA7AD88